MPEKEQAIEYWHLDKRVSLTHIITTVSVIFAVLVWSLQLQGSIDTNSVFIQKNAEDISELKEQITAQYAEIIRRLERLDDRG